MVGGVSTQTRLGQAIANHLITRHEARRLVAFDESNRNPALWGYLPVWGSVPFLLPFSQALVSRFLGLDQVKKGQTTERPRHNGGTDRRKRPGPSPKNSNQQATGTGPRKRTPESSFRTSKR